MANVIKICKVCGKRYEACSNAEKYDGVFRYQTVACSPECGAIYLAQVMESRGLSVDSIESNLPHEPAKKSRKKSSKKLETTDKAIEPTDE